MDAIGRGEREGKRKEGRAAEIVGTNSRLGVAVAVGGGGGAVETRMG